MPPRFKKKHVPRRRDDDVVLTPGSTVTQTVKRDGVRVVIKQKMLSDGTVKTTVDKAHTLEADLQAEQVARLRSHPSYEREFTFAGSMEAGKRGPVASAEAKRTGMIAGEPDMRITLKGGKVIYVENKNGGGYLSQEQKDRHEVLTRLGGEVWVIKTDDKEEAATLIVGLVDDYLRGDESFERKERYRSG